MSDGKMLLRYVLGIPLLVWLILSSIMFIWWTYRTNSKALMVRRYQGVDTIVYSGAFIALFSVLMSGFERFTGEGTGALPTVLICVFLFEAFKELEALRIQKQQAVIDETVKKRIQNLSGSFSNKEFLIRKKLDIQKEFGRLHQELAATKWGHMFLDKIVHGEPQTRLYANDEIEYLVLWSVQAKLDSIIKDSSVVIKS